MIGSKREGSSAGEEVVAVLWNTQHESSLFNQFQIEPSGSTFLVVRFASPAAGPRMIGAYQASLNASEPLVRGVFDSIRDGRFLELEETMPLGNRVATQAILIARTEEDVKSFESGMDDSFVAPLDQLAKRLADAAKATLPFPTATIGLEWELDRSEYSAGDACRIHLQFKNEGSIPVVFGNPRWRSEEVPSELSLEWWAKGMGPEGTDERTMIWNLAEAEWARGPREAIPTGDDMLPLAGNSVLDIDVQWQIPRMTPGPYAVRAVLRSVNPREEESTAFVEGLLYSEPKEFKVLPVSK